MKYKVTLNGRTYEVEVEAGKAMLIDEYEAYAPAAAPVAAPVAAAPAAAPVAAPAQSGVTVSGGEIVGSEAVRKSYPGFFADMESLGGKVEIL